MNKESIVVSRRKAQQLREAGVPQSSIFSWYTVPDKHNGGDIWYVEEQISSGDLSAYTEPELRVMLPKMGLLQLVLYVVKTRLKPDAVADLVISKI